MKVVAITGEKSSQLVDRPDPVARGEFVVVRIDVCPLCTEYKAWLHGWKSDSLGHEAAGTVVATDGKRSVSVGDRVVVMPQYPCGRCRLCRQGEYVYCEHSLDALAVTGNAAGTATYAQLMIKQDWMLVHIPDSMSTEHGAMANCALGPAFGGARRIGLLGEDTVLISGLGPVGLGAVIVAKWMGARVIATDPSPYRSNLARELGADVVLDPADPDVVSQIKGLTAGLGVDKVLECSGSPAAQRLGIDAIRRLGSYAFVGEGGQLAVGVSDDFIRKGIAVHGSWYYNFADTLPLLRLIEECASGIDRLITHRFAMSEIEKAWDLQSQGLCGKVLIDPAR